MVDILQQKGSDPNLFPSGSSSASLYVHPCKIKRGLRQHSGASVGEMHTDIVMEGHIYVHPPKCAGLRILPCPDERRVRDWN